jgi:beta-glucuronidase
MNDLNQEYGIAVIMGNFLGAYTIGSGADWDSGTDYGNKEHQKNMLADVEAMVQEYRDEPYLLCWLLGNENDLPGDSENATLNNTNAALKPKKYAKFLKKVRQKIAELDPDHPVGVCLGSYKMLPYLKKYAPNIDFLGFNAYLGYFGFGTLWNRVKISFDRPVLISEYGSDAYNQNQQQEDELSQALYHLHNWKDIVHNSSAHTQGKGNAIGGVIYYWVDRWWLYGNPYDHDTGGWQGPSPDGWFNDEWFGMLSQGNGNKSPFLRQPRKIYDLYKKVWAGAQDVTLLIQELKEETNRRNSQ